MIGNSEIEPAEPSCVAIDVTDIFFQRFVLVIRPMFIDDLANEAIVGG